MKGRLFPPVAHQLSAPFPHDKSRESAGRPETPVTQILRQGRLAVVEVWLGGDDHLGCGQGLEGFARRIQHEQRGAPLSGSVASGT